MSCTRSKVPVARQSEGASLNDALSSFNTDPSPAGLMFLVGVGGGVDPVDWGPFALADMV
jgi:hypothetical protein